MLKNLNRPIALSVATRSEATKATNMVTNEEQLDAQVLLYQGQRIMLTSNIGTHVGLVNGALGEIVDIIYSIGSKPPEVLLYIIEIDKYIGLPWNEEDPKLVPIIPSCLGNRRKMPITMTWTITIHISQELTLDKEIADIGSTEGQGLTFTALSRVKTLDGLCLQPTFSFEIFVKM